MHLPDLSLFSRFHAVNPYWHRSLVERLFKNRGRANAAHKPQRHASTTAVEEKSANEKTADESNAEKSEEVAKAVIFLASHDASYITGVELNIDGGMGQL